MVHRVGGRPLHLVVAVLANVARVDMRLGLARGIDAVVAACAVARDVRVVERRRYPAVGRVAVVTGVATREMPGMLAGGYGAVVAGRAGTEHLRVVYTIGRRPLHRGMTVFAHVARRHVRRPLAGRVNAIVATEAITRDIRVVEGGGYPAIRGVAVVTGIAARDVPRVFARRDGAVVAGRAGTEHLRVIDTVSRRPEDLVVAVLANVGRIDMGRTLADGVDTVVAAHAVARNVHMVEVRRYPAVRRMAVVTGVAALNMRGVFSGSHRAVMARAASADDLGVVHGIGRRPDHVVMAVFAEVARVDVGGRFSGRFDAVVAARAVVDDAGVIEGGRYPTIRGVAVVAVIAAGDVRRVFACRNGTVVTRAANPYDLRVVHGIGRGPLHVVVAVTANIGRRYMGGRLTRRADAVVTAAAVVENIGVIEVGR